MRTDLPAVFCALIPSHLSQDLGDLSLASHFSYVTDWDKMTVGKMNPTKCQEMRGKEK